MKTATPEDLRQAYKKERDPRVARRMAAVNMVCVNNESIQHTADSLMQCPNLASGRVKRFREGGIGAPEPSRGGQAPEGGALDH